MSASPSEHRTVAVYPGLFFLANVQIADSRHPSDMVTDMYATQAVCQFTDGGIVFNSTFQSHVTSVVIEFLSGTAPKENGLTSSETADGTIVLRDGGLRFENPDQVMNDTLIMPPFTGPCHVRVVRRVLISPKTYTPPDDESDPAGLEEWSVIIWHLDKEINNS